MHTDESWLSGLSRSMITQKTPAATEYFFDLVERSPHAIKILFHGIQILFIRILGYSLFSVRLISLLTGTLCLTAFSKICRRLAISELTGTILLSVQIQFIYSSHFARQEIQILLLMLLSIMLLLNSEVKSTGSFKRGLLAGLPIAAAIGFHPNAFIAAWPAGLFILAEIIKRKRNWQEGAGYLLTPAVSAVFFILLSCLFSRGFIKNYSSFGAAVGFFDPFDVKLLSFDDFYRKLFLRISGTYYTPEIRPVIIIASVSLLILIILRITRYRNTDDRLLLLCLCGMAGVNTGIVIIGKYSAPSAVFLIPFLILLIAGALESLKLKTIRRTTVFAAAAILAFNSSQMISKELEIPERYSDFTAAVRKTIPAEKLTEGTAQQRVLGPLTAEFALDEGRLLDWRNMAMLRNAGLSLEEWIDSNNIGYIIYTEELDVIYKNRPVWNLLYGNPTVYHEQLQNFLEARCTLLHQFGSPGYGTRIVFHRNTKDWQVKIFRVKD